MLWNSVFDSMELGTLLYLESKLVTIVAMYMGVTNNGRWALFEYIFHKT